MLIGDTEGTDTGSSRNDTSEQNDAVNWKAKYITKEATFKKEASGRDSKIAEQRAEIDKLKREQKRIDRTGLSVEDLKKDFDRELLEIKNQTAVDKAQVDADKAKLEAKYAELQRQENVRQVVSNMSEDTPSWLTDWKLAKLSTDANEIEDSFKDILNRMSIQIQQSRNYAKAGGQPRTGVVPKGVIDKKKYEAMTEEMRTEYYRSLSSEDKIKFKGNIGAA